MNTMNDDFPKRENNSNCKQLFDLSYVMERGLRSPLMGINDEQLNYTPADNKMSIGQLAIHCTGWASYFIADTKWEVVPWTCVPVDYPLSLDEVNRIIDEGFDSIRNKLKSIDDDLLEVEAGKRGKGYIIYRLLIHAMTHSNQMAYIRQIVEPEWDFGNHFGDMATALISMSYSTQRDEKIGGF